MSFPYNPNVPNPPDNPSVDVGDMHTNASSISNILAVDHFGFNNPNGGKHQQVTMPSRGTTAPTVAGVGALYVNTDSAGQQALWFTRDGVGIGSNIQLTTSKIVNPLVANPGYTFLPGAILMEWGTVSFAGGSSHLSGSVTFPLALTGIFVISTALLTSDITNTIASNTIAVKAKADSSGFDWVYNSSSSSGSTTYPGFTWTVIGI